MSTTSKSGAVAHADPSRSSGLYRVAIVGAATLKGKEVAEVLTNRNFPSVDVKLLDDDESLGRLEPIGDEVSFIQNLRPEQFQHIDFTFFASDQERTRKTWKTAQQAGSAIVDLSAGRAPVGPDAGSRIAACPSGRGSSGSRSARTAALEAAKLWRD